MSTIEANISIDLPDGVDPSQIIAIIQNLVTGINDLDTVVSVNEVDNPLSLSPINMKKIKE